MVLITTVALTDKGSHLIPSVAYNGSLKVKEYFFKLLLDGNYDLGFLGSDALCKFHFFCVTNRFHECFMMDIYVKNLRAGSFKIELSSRSEIVNSDANYCYLTDEKTNFEFLNQAENTFNYLKTYSFTQSDQSIGFLNTTTLDVPITIWWGVEYAIPEELERNVMLMHGFGELLNENSNHDCEIVKLADSKIGRFIEAFILFSHSKLLYDMVSSGGELNLDDVNIKEWNAVRDFLYNQSVQNIEQYDCKSLLRISDKYGLAGLKFLAENALINKINTSNALDLLALSDLYSADVLQKKVMEFVIENKEIFESEDWKNNENVDLAKKMFVTYSLAKPV